jgi:hypothetical protein
MRLILFLQRVLVFPPYYDLQIDSEAGVPYWCELFGSRMARVSSDYKRVESTEFQNFYGIVGRETVSANFRWVHRRENFLFSSKPGGML